jgi:hypothetical protein
MKAARPRSGRISGIVEPNKSSGVLHPDHIAVWEGKVIDPAELEE